VVSGGAHGYREVYAPLRERLRLTILFVKPFADQRGRRHQRDLAASARPVL